MGSVHFRSPQQTSSSAVQKWYLRSYDNGDTHPGLVNTDTTVTARCGMTFVPLPRRPGRPRGNIEFAPWNDQPPSTCLFAA